MIFEEMWRPDVIFDTVKIRFEIATNQSLNLSPIVSTLGLFYCSHSL